MCERGRDGLGVPDGGAHRFGGQLLEAVVETIPDMIFVKDAESRRFVLFNKAGEELLGVPRGRVLGRTDHDLFAADQADAFAARDREVLAAGATVETPEEEVVSPTRGVRVLHSTRCLIDAGGGGPRYILGIARDVTERRAQAGERDELERQLREAQKLEAVGLLAGGIAHDFNNLLTVILAAGQALLETVGPERAERRDVEDIIASTHRGAELVRQLLAFGRRQVAAPRVLDVNAVVADVERLLRRLLGERVTLLCVPARDLGLVRADPGQLEQVLVNLVVNARDAMPDGGTLTVATANVELDERFARAHAGARVGPHVMLSVTDTGVGMSAEVRARLFEPFFTTKPPGKGTGLGLSTVYGIVRQSGGCIVAESGPGHGTIFRVFLPRAAPAERVPREEATPTGSLFGSETVLVVEDDAAVRELTVRVLRGYGYTALAATDAEGAASLADAHRGLIHLLVTDIVTPGPGGAALAAQLTAARPEMDVLYVSGHTHDAVVHHGVAVHGVALLRKPFTPVALARAVRSILDRDRRRP